MYRQGNLYIRTQDLTHANIRVMTKLAKIKFKKIINEYTVFFVSDSVLLKEYKHKIVKPNYEGGFIDLDTHIYLTTRRIDNARIREIKRIKRKN